MRHLLLSLLLLVVFFPMSAFAQEKKRPNVLFLFTDDQRADTIAALGNKHIKTPNLDTLVRRGTTFTRAYCMGAMQGAVCVPSRAMVMSGRTLFKVNANLQGITTWPAMFAGLGYRTFITGKWHNQEASVLAAFMEGKSIFLGGMGDPYALPIADITSKRTLSQKKLSGKHSVELFADGAIEFIKKQKGTDKPFVAYVAFNGPHDPRTAPKEYHDAYNKDKPPLPPNFLPVHPFNNGDMIGRDERLAPWPRTPVVVRQHLADYYAYITFVDAQIGRILAALREAGLEEDTIIVFASDHGLAIGSHGLFGKQNLYDHSMHAPLIFAGPGVPQGKQSEAFCYLLDIFPTLGGLTGVAGPEGSEGKSLVPVLTGEKKQVRDSIFTAYRQFQRSVRDERWHMIVYPHINKTQLFDLQNDPHEIKDLAGDSAHAKQIERLTGKLKDWQQELGDTQPLRSEKPLPPEFDFSKVPPEEKKKNVKEKVPGTSGRSDPRSERLLLEITKVGNEQLIATQSSKVLVVTPAIKTVVDSGMDAVPILLNAMGNESISFDAFTRCYSACDQILVKADPHIRVFWTGGCYTKEVDGVARIFPRGLGDDQKEFRSEVMSDIRAKWQAFRKKKER